jgi:TPR repeat protein
MNRKQMHAYHQQGRIYLMRNQNRQDLRNAIQWLRLPACCHHSDAQHDLALCYQKLGCTEKALFWFVKGAAHRDQRCMLQAGRMFKKKGNLGPARYYLDKLAQLNSEEARNLLQIMDGLSYKNRATLENAYAGDVEAIFAQGFHYLCRLPEKRQQHGEIAFGLAKLKLAAELGHKDARKMYDGYLEAHEYWLTRHKDA